jgi:hypothetical protein
MNIHLSLYNNIIKNYNGFIVITFFPLGLIEILISNKLPDWSCIQFTINILYYFIILYYKMPKGGKLKAKEVKDFLNASYEKSPPNDLDGYILDKSLSSATAKVYYNPQTNHAVVAHRGTKGTADWGNNLAYALGAYEYTPRYKQGKKTQDKAEAKYGKQNISTLGHSQGAILARKLGTNTKEVINVNPAYTFEKPKKNEYNIRSSTDVVSGLYAPVAKTREILFPKYSEKHDITIPSQSTFDVLGEHSYDILDRLGEKEIGVGAGNKISSNNIMKAGKRYSRLGYTGEDIDWLGGGVITTNNNNGGVGTPYVNRGTNPYGTRGAGRHYDEIEGGNIDYNTAFGIGMGAVAGSAALYKLTQMIQELINNRQQVHPEAVAEMLQDAIAEPGEFDIEEGIPTAEQWISPPEGLPTAERWISPAEGLIPYEEIEGGKIKNPFKSVSKAFAPVKKTFDKAGVKMNTGAAKVATAINPMTYALGNKDTRNAMIQSGKITHDYLLPAVVSAGKPIFDATAMVGSTMLTGNPLLGKVAADTVWNEMVAKKGNDPRQNQKSKELGELSTVFGQALAKPYTAALGGYRLKAGYRLKGKGRDDDREARYSYFSSQLPPEQNTRELTDRERDAVRMSTLELVLEQAVETGNEEIVENVIAEMRELDGMLRRPQFFYDEDDNYLEESEDELDLDRYRAEHDIEEEEEEDEEALQEMINRLTGKGRKMKGGKKDSKKGGKKVKVKKCN